MIGVDTNVLVRIFVDDDPRQTESAKGFVDSRTESDPAFVSSVVLAELVWALEKSYDFQRAELFVALDALFESSDVVVERQELMGEAIELARGANADVADCIIAVIATNSGCSSTVTFDRPASRRIPGMELLK